MLILTIRTDKAESEVGLYDDETQLVYEKWEAHRRLSATIHKKIEAILKSQNHEWHDIQAVAVFKGPGSFTGLRIGLTVGNTISDGLKIPIVGEVGDDWISLAINRLKNNENEHIAMPEYGAAPNITAPRK